MVLELTRGGDKPPLYLFNAVILADGTIQSDGYFSAQDISITEELFFENRIFYLVRPLTGDPVSPFSIGFPVETHRLSEPIELETLSEPVST